MSRYAAWIDDEQPDEGQIEMAIESLGFKLKAIPENEVSARSDIKKDMAYLNSLSNHSKLPVHTVSEAEDVSLDFTPLVDYRDGEQVSAKRDDLIKEMLKKGMLSKGVNGLKFMVQ